MLEKSVKNIIVFIFLLAAFERTGAELISFLSWNFENVQAELIDSAESTSKESEKNEGKSARDLWFANGLHTLSHPISIADSDQIPSINTNIFHSYFPSVPTPPPNLIFV